MGILIGLVPAIAWGMQPLVITKIGGKPINQLIGTTLGTFWISVLVLLTMITMAPSTYNWFYSPVFLCSFASGLGWAIGQILQYTAFKIMGVAKAMPLSTGLQLILINIFSVCVYGDWHSSKWPYQELLVGFTAVILIVIGVFFISYKQKKPEPGFIPEKVIRPKVKLTYIILIFAIGTLGYLAYFVLGELPTHIYTMNDIYSHMFNPMNTSVISTNELSIFYGFSQFFPQATAMFSMTICFAMFLWLKPCFGKQKVAFKKVVKDCPFAQSRSYFNMIDGLVFSAAALTILLSKSLNGTATATTLSQTNILLATLGGLFILKEHKPKRELWSTIGGLLLVLCGGIMIGLLSTMFPVSS